MDLTLLVDNNTFIDRYLTAEPGLSILIEDDDVNVLFDVGYSDLFLKNAAKLGKDLSRLDYLVLSHSHLDHTWGLDPYIRYLAEGIIEGRPVQPPTLVAHPEVFCSVGIGGLTEIGSLVSKEKAGRHMELALGKAPVNLSPRLTFLGEIPRENDFEGKTPLGIKQTEAGPVPDLIPDDTALAYKSDQGLVIITGCSHSGICNIISHARNVCKEDQNRRYHRRISPVESTPVPDGGDPGIFPADNTQSPARLPLHRSFIKNRVVQSGSAEGNRCRPKPAF